VFVSYKCNVWLVVGGYHMVPNCTKGGGPAIIKEYLVRHAFSPYNRGCVSKLEGYYDITPHKGNISHLGGLSRGHECSTTI
jgi:hypothetical protein